MKKFGTPIGAAPGIASEKVGLSSVGVPSTARPGTLALAFFLASRSSCATSFLLFVLPALNLRLPGCALPEGALPEPPWVRFGAPGFPLPSGVGVELRLRLDAGHGRHGGDGRDRQGRRARSASARRSRRCR